MSHHPVTEFLIRRWALPESKVSLVEALSRDCAQGGTALKLPEELRTQQTEGEHAWGKAAAYADELDPNNPPPLVLVKAKAVTLLQTWSHHRAEVGIARALKERLQDKGMQGLQIPAEVERFAEALFPEAKNSQAEADQLQFIAAKTALSKNFSLITGGPGTGKTTTLAKILALLVEAAPADKTLRIQLGAPTGKAAERMREAVEKAVGSLVQASPALKQKLLQAAAGARTLHKILGYNPRTGNLAWDQTAPLPLDILVIDEASMIDVFLWNALLAATPPGAKLLVLGDPCQLESVSAGRVLADLVHAAQYDSALDAAWTYLRKSYRFEKRPDIARLAEAIASADPDKIEQLFTNCSGVSSAGGLHCLGETAGSPTWNDLPRSIQTAIRAVAQASTPKEALRCLSKVCLLSAQREHSFGASGLSAMIERALFENLALSSNQEQGALHNQPIIINHNDLETGLNNGSVGVICSGPGGERLAWFPATDPLAAPRSFPLGKLPEHSPAWALTIHRSQGSEYDQVYVLLPREDSPLATKELIYTAITRAREEVYLAGPLSTLKAAALAEQQRTTCLAHLFSA